MADTISKRNTSIDDRPPLVNVRKTYSQLTDLLKSLQKKVTDLSTNIDTEILSTYRVHILSIQSEIKKLKQDVTNGEEALNNDGSVAKLETEVKWFVDECNRLKVQYSAMENDSLQMDSRLKDLSKQDLLLNEQLKSIMRKNNVLQAEIDHAKEFKRITSTTLKLPDITQTYSSSLNAGPNLSRKFESQTLHQSSSMSKINKVTKNELTDGPILSQTAPIFRNLTVSYSQPTMKTYSGEIKTNFDKNNEGLILSVSEPGLQSFNSSLHGKSSPSSLDKKLKPNSSGLFLGHDVDNSESVNQRQFNKSRGRHSSPTKELSTPHTRSRSNSAQRFHDSKISEGSSKKTHDVLNDLLHTRTQGEIEIERAISDIFNEIRLRRGESAKLKYRRSDNNHHGAMDQYVSMTSKQPNQSMKEDENPFPLRTVPKAKVRGHSTSPPSSPTLYIQENVNGEINPTYRMGLLDVPLLDKIGTIQLSTPSIVDAGGMSGTGLDQFADNDKFSTIVKYLMNIEQFQAVVENLQSKIF